MSPRMVFLTPSYRPAGGVVKIIDYLQHAKKLGFRTLVCCPEPYDPELPLFRNERFRDITPAEGTQFTNEFRFGMDEEDFVFFSWPTHYQYIAPRLRQGLLHEQAIHIVQNVRHANPTFANGYAVRLLSMPMSRIMTNDFVLEACRPHLNPDSFTRVIDLGLDTDYFSLAREGSRTPLRVGYTTWKSEVGDAVRESLSDDGRFEFRAIRDHVPWDELRELYQWCDVFLSTPDPEEGLYMPGLEAMAAGAIVVTPDAGGNRAYCEFGVNCLPVEFENPEAYVHVLRHIAELPAEELEEMRAAGYATTGGFSLQSEYEAFASFMDELGTALDVKRVGQKPLDGYTILRRLLIDSQSAESPTSLEWPRLEAVTEVSEGRLPDFLGIGAQKAGTTWLHQNLGRHPGIWLPKEKELHYFDEKFGRSRTDPANRAIGRDSEAERWRRQLERQLRTYEAETPSRADLDWDLTYFLGRPSDAWYASLFRPEHDWQIVGEFTPEYSALPAEVIGHIRDIMPDLKVIFFMRNPIERAWSHASMFRRLKGGGDDDATSDHLLGRRSRQLTDYVSIIDRWTSFFPDSQFFLGFLEDISNAPELLVRRLSSFLGVSVEHETPAVIHRVIHSGEIETIPTRFAHLLAESYIPMIDELSRRYGGHATGWLECAHAILERDPTTGDLPYPLSKWSECDIAVRTDIQSASLADFGGRGKGSGPKERTSID